ncbi:hypothetical protein [Microlunatus parietis]|uniref:Uncharacterized protein n=1 Tax=Microlunatus parietis TaxID=682979 RepID=A0A7Y9I8A2_9ACTN|nr:hypothetical protein [Microlunatus parietis]NYE72052.1 hypothetical protein [Microlunatus parietis]
MTTYLLREGHSVRVDALPIAIRVQPVGGGPFGHRVEVAGQHGPVRTVRRPDQVIVPVIDQPVQVSLLPEGEAFGPQSVVTVALGPDSPAGGDADRAVLDQVDLSGLHRRDIVIMEPDAGRIKISTVGVVNDEALPPTAEMARDAARGVLGLPRLPAERRVRLAVGLDTSASMRRLPPDRLVRPCLELFAGLSVVIAGDQTGHGTLVGWQSVPVPTGPAAEFASSMITGLADRPLDIGCRSGLFEQSTAGPGADRTARFLITDAVPPGLAGRTLTGVVVIGEAQPPGPLGGGATGVPVLSDDQPLDRDQVGRIVASLLAAAGPLIGAGNLIGTP